MAKKKKVRVDLRKNRTKPPRPRQWTRGFQEHGFTEEATRGDERVRAKGDLSRRRTIIQEEGEAAPGAATVPAEMPAVDRTTSLCGRVLRVHRLFSVVETDDGRQYRCVVRQVLRSLSIDERAVVAAGDRVGIRVAAGDEGWIERIEPRHGLLTRASRGREHVLAANVDQVVIVVSLVEPELKPHLIDRYLASAAQGGIAPLVCLNKADLVDPVLYQPLVGLYVQLDIPTLLTSATTGLGIARLRACLRGRQTVFSGQSGVGKSSLLNALQPGLGLHVREVSETNQKGRHTTAATQLLRLDLSEAGTSGADAVAWVFDTPGIRQFQLWDILPEEVEGFFPEFRPLVHLCAFPDCTHTHEDRCAIQRAVRRRQISASRYESYLGLFAGELLD